MPTDRRLSRFGLLAGAAFAGLLALCDAASADRSDVASTSALEWELLEAETAVAQSEPRIAASHYRGALREAWLLLGRIAVAEGELQTARDALARSRAAAATGLAPARVALALVELRLGEVEEPLRELRLTSQEDHRNATVLRRFAEALWATGRDDELDAALDQLRDLAPAEATAVTAGPRQAPLPDVGSLATASVENRQELRQRLAATLVRCYRNLAVLHARTGFTQSLADLEAARDAVPAAYPDADLPYGKIDLAHDEPIESVRPIELDPVELIAAVPASLHSIVEQLDSGEIEAAEAELRAAGSTAWTRTLLGLLLGHRGEVEAAEVELRKALEALPAPSITYQALARLCLRSGRHDEAIEQLRNAAALGELDRDLAFVLAKAEIAAGRNGAAVRHLRTLDKRHGSVEALYLLAQTERSTGRVKQAFDAAERATRHAPNSEEVLLTHARAALDIEVVNSAARSVEPLVRMRPNVAEYRVLLGRAWVLRRKMGEAVEAFGKAVELDPSHAPAFLPLGLALNHESRFAEARTYFERYLETHPDNLDALAGLAESEERLGETEAAEHRARQVLARSSNGRAHLVVGLVLAGRQEFAEARDSFQQAISADPTLAKAHYQLSLACARLADRDCARAHLERYKRLLEGPEHVELQPASDTQLMTRQKGGSADEPPP